MQRKACVKEGATGGVQEKSGLNFTKMTGKHMYPSFCFNNVAGLRPATLLKRRTPTQVFSCQLYEIFENIFFIEHFRVTASDE